MMNLFWGTALAIGYLLQTGNTTTSQVRITFAAVGDINFGTPRSILQRQSNPLALVQSLLAGRDVVYGNLETPVTSRPLRNVAFPQDCHKVKCSKTQS